MSLKAGEIARETGNYRCEGCRGRISIVRGAVIRECPNCGGSSFQIARVNIVRQQSEAYRRRAEEVRTAADQMQEKSCRESLQRLAASYEHLAESLERMAERDGLVDADDSGEATG